MPRYRQLQLKIIDSFDFNEMPNDFTRLVWVLLPLILDCEGRGIDNMTWIKGKMFPLRDDIEISQLSHVLEWFENRKNENDVGMIVRYNVNGRKYFYVPTFKLYQTGTDREAKSSIPSPELLASNSEPSPELVNPPALHCIELNCIDVESELNCIESEVEQKEILNQPLQANISITPIQAWDKLKDSLEGEMKRDLFIDKLSTTEVVDYSPGLFTIGTKSDYQIEWLEGRLRSKILKEMSGICNRAVNVQFVRMNGNP